MYYRFIYLVLLIQLLPLSTNAQVKTINLASFGARPNDKISDQPAFLKAAAFINQCKTPVRLVINAGKYIAGPSPKDNYHTGIVTDVLLLKNCNHVQVEGLGKVQVQFMDSLYFGTMPGIEKGKDSAVHIGSLFRLINCRDISIKNLDAFGNNQHFRLLKKWGAGTNPYEREHEGLFILNSSNITVTNVTFRNFGRDGALILQEAGMPPSDNIRFTNCSFINNGRNGFSWCGGSDVTFYNCRFNANGNGIIKTNPAGGLDIEPERGSDCSRGLFRKCSFSGNGGYAISSGYGNADHVIFDSCDIEGNHNYSVFCNSPFFTFQNCRVSGTSLFTYDAASESAGIKLLNCSFSDMLNLKKSFILNYLVGVTGRYIRFTGCSFSGTDSPLFYTEIKKKEKADSRENTFFAKCVFNAFFTKPGIWKNNAMLVSNSNFEDCTFNSRGEADFKILEDPEKNLRSQNSIMKTSRN